MIPDDLKETLEHTERVLDTMSTFYRHSATWKMFKGTECLERVRKALVTLAVPEPKGSGGTRPTRT